jgi:hypothetical protein
VLLFALSFLLMPDIVTALASPLRRGWDLPRVQVEAFILLFQFMSVLCALLHVKLESVQSAPKAALSLCSA